MNKDEFIEEMQSILEKSSEMDSFGFISSDPAPYRVTIDYNNGCIAKFEGESFDGLLEAIKGKTPIVYKNDFMRLMDKVSEMFDDAHKNRGFPFEVVMEQAGVDENTRVVEIDFSIHLDNLSNPVTFRFTSTLSGILFDVKSFLSETSPLGCSRKWVSHAEGDPFIQYAESNYRKKFEDYRGDFFRRIDSGKRIPVCDVLEYNFILEYVYPFNPMERERWLLSNMKEDMDKISNLKD